MNEPLERLTIHFIGGPLTLELPRKLHAGLARLYRPFLTDGPAPLTVTFDVQPPVDYNIELGLRLDYPEAGGRRSIREPRFELLPTEAGARVRYRLSGYQDVDYVLRAWATMCLLPPKGFLFHAAGIVTPRGRGFLICGRSGGGKSTLAGNLLGRPGWRVLSDEMPAVRRGSGGWTVDFTPFWGDLEPRMPVVTRAGLAGVCALEKGDAVGLEPLTARDGAALLLASVTSYEPPPWFADLVLPFATELSRRVPAHRLTVPRTFEPAALAGLLDENGP
ncbi:MAG: hypothetical protein A2Y64_06505 [Candidatus Coatesbacteria bacterium RBG_13_66_14]|uniref:HPr kinase/phosphorylase C-terminal domain-containing protein n=1 Tax=Candidatus Coatesbacteria bacterium RBG_13_66_14 TaxID=1817816 RepID=A0A1F5FFU3_9BACT|nr:MAG: hypothetical protein A2Y64_06505 [Candidatus Coatesbacteria bacterium RBG_13_66_14]